MAEPLSFKLSSSSSTFIFSSEYVHPNCQNSSSFRGSEKRMGEASVKSHGYLQEYLGNNILLFCRGDSYKFHVAGREDVDVQMLGSCRPFLVEIQNTCLLAFEVIINELQSKINSSENKLVGIRNLKVVGSEGWALVQEGEAEKQQYASLVWISRPLEDDDFFINIITPKLDEKAIFQLYSDATKYNPLMLPLRVTDDVLLFHFRMKIEKVAESSQNCHIRNKRLQAKKVPQRLRDIKDVLVLIFYGLLVVRLLIVMMRLMQSMIDFAIIILIFSVLICLRFYSGHIDTRKPYSQAELDELRLNSWTNESIIQEQ
uniref:tRNA pseudouridine(55) synthase n=1 Tax=Cucumis melo TaxID=3656 RepID=A0A9I9EMT4_CUCME